MKRDFFTKDVGYQRMNALNMFPNTMIAICKGCGNLFFFFSNDTMFFFRFLFLKSRNKKKRKIHYCNLTIVSITVYEI